MSHPIPTRTYEEDEQQEQKKELRMRIDQELFQSIEAMKFVQEQMNTLFELSKKQ